MRICLIITAAWILLCGGCASTSAPAAGGEVPIPDSAEEIVAELDNVQHPVFDESKSGDEAYVQQHTDASNRVWDRIDQLQAALYERFPEHPQAELYLAIHWMNQLTRQKDPAVVAREIEEYRTAHPEGPKSDQAKRIYTLVRTRLAGADADKTLELAEEFARANPHHETAADFLLEAAEKMTDAESRRALLQRIMLEYPNSSSALRAGGQLRRASQIGMPFDIGFFDAITGEWMHSHMLKGKVVLIDFWATWCGPCIGEIPRHKELYAKYHDQGLEIIYVSLDGPRTDTNLETVKEFVKEHQLNWYHYYQGESFDSGFSRSWGINSIPTTFLLDREGKLVSTDARDKLNDLIPRLLQSP